MSNYWIKFSIACVLIQLPTQIYSKTKCKEDGFFRHPDDCSMFITCSNGVSQYTACPEGLLYNLETQYCDWPEAVDCDIDIDKITSRKIKEDVLLYLTFDDGPSEETETILNVLKKHNVPGTFFVNSKNLFDPKMQTKKLMDIVNRMSKEGHVVGDHSFDHMFHNSLSVSNAYLSVEKDKTFFGKRNIMPILESTDNDLIEFTNFTMFHYIRLPYTNNWRVPAINEGQKPIVSDCVSCTTPRNSGELGIRLANEFYESGRVIMGWDTEWGMNFVTNKYKYGGLQMFTRLKHVRPKRSRQIVILTHDRGFTGDAEELSRFILLCKKTGYTFRTIENYVFDDIN
nr:LOW QUALITY PROTEIN: chitin disaccharide deacetylase-like [Lepeophtheirus salmonis]